MKSLKKHEILVLIQIKIRTLKRLNDGSNACRITSWINSLNIPF